MQTNEVNMKKIASLSIVEDVKNQKFLMIEHMRGINKGCKNFPGGKKEPFETIEECVIRETLEETGLEIHNPIEVGYIEFPTKNFYVYVFKSTDFSGKIIENKDEAKVFWIDKKDIPYDQMREADKDFLPEILNGKYIKRRYIYDEDFHLKDIINL
jgi:8-oxo-dGTP pyrophosphatase MutT (NUDIX family)